MALSIYFHLDIGPTVLNAVKIWGSGWPFLQDCGGWKLSSAPVFHDITCLLVGWVIVLLQHPVGNAIGREQLVPTRQESVLMNISVLMCSDVIGCLPLCISEAGLLLWVASHKVAAGDSMPCYGNIQIYTHGVVHRDGLGPGIHLLATAHSWHAHPGCWERNIFISVNITLVPLMCLFSVQNTTLFSLLPSEINFAGFPLYGLMDVPNDFAYFLTPAATLVM